MISTHGMELTEAQVWVWKYSCVSSQGPRPDPTGGGPWHTTNARFSRVRTGLLCNKVAPNWEIETTMQVLSSCVPASRTWARLHRVGPQLRTSWEPAAQVWPGFLTGLQQRCQRGPLSSRRFHRTGTSSKITHVVVSRGQFLSGCWAEGLRNLLAGGLLLSKVSVRWRSQSFVT